MEVCLVTKYFYPIPGGGCERWRRYIPGLRRRGISVSVKTIQYDDLPQEQVVDETIVQRFSVPGASLSRLLGQAVRDFKRDDQWPDALVLLSGFNFLMVPHLLALRRHSVPCVLATTMLPGTRIKLPIRILRMLESIATGLLFSAVLCGSAAMAQSLRRYGVRKDILRIVPHGVDIERFRPWKSPEERHSLRNELRIPPDAVVILFVGHLTARKGADYMLGAFELLAKRDTRALLVYVGGRWEFNARSKRFADDLTTSISTSPYADRILLVGAVQNVAEYFRAADIFVFPSEREGMPNAVLEAMATGLPCVLTPFVGLSDEFGSPDVEYKLVERNTVSVAEAAMELIQNDAERSALGQAARRRVERHISLERTLDQIADIIREIVPNQPT